MNRLSTVSSKKLLKLVSGIFILIFVIKLLESFFPFHHGDALNYHLVGPKLWLETSWLEMTYDLWGNFQSGIFEILYLIPVGIFSNTIKAQQFSQLIHFIFGQGLGAFLLYQCFKDKDKVIALMAAISILTIAKGTDFFLYAKNDGPLASLSFLSYLLIFEKDKLPTIRGQYRHFFIGALLGIIPAIKMSGLFVVLFLGPSYLITNRHKIKETILPTLLAILIFAPIIIRNTYFLESPFFPGLLSLFPGNLSPFMLDYYVHHMSNPLSADSFFKLLKVFFLGKIALGLSIPILIYQFKKRYFFHPSIFISIGILSIYMALNGGIVSERFFFTCYLLNIYFVFNFLAQKKLNGKLLVFLLVLILLDSKLDKSIKRVPKSFEAFAAKSTIDYTMSFSPLSGVWKYITPNKGEKTWVITDAFAQQFYAPKGVRLDQHKARPRTEFLGRCHRSGDLDLLRKYQYAILFHNIENPCYQKIRKDGVFMGDVLGNKIYKL